MADKKTQKGLDALRNDIQELAESFWAFRDTMLTNQAAHAAETGTPSKSATATPLEPGDPFVAASGSYVMPTVGGESETHAWSLPDSAPTDIVALDTDRAAQIFAAIGHQGRLAVALRLIQKPATAAALVNELSLGTTGAAYHHVNVLQKAGIVIPLQRGVFGIAPEHVATILVCCAAIAPTLSRSVTPTT